MGRTRDLARDREVVDHLGLGRDAIARQAWAEARDHLARADPAALTPHDWHSLGTAAYLVADRDTAVGAWQQAFTLHTRAGEPVAAAMDANWIAFVHNTTGNISVGSGWVARGLRLLDGEPDDAEPRGFFAIHEFYRLLEGGDFPAAAACGERVLDIGRRWGNADLVSFGLVGRGRLLIYTGRVAEGLGLLDEAMTCLTNGEVSAIASGNIYCAMIEGCQEISDYRRMSEWTDALNDFTRRNAGRRATIEIDDPEIGAQMLGRGALVGVTYDPHDRRIEIMVGDAHRARRHLMHSIPKVESIAMTTDEHSASEALELRHGRGHTLVLIKR